MHEPPPIMIDMLSDLDEQLAAQLITVLRAFSDALEQHYAGTLAPWHPGATAATPLGIVPAIAMAGR